MAELVKQEGNSVEFKVSVPAGEVSRAYQQVWTAVARDVRVPGFRPGKAPKSVLAQRLRKGYIEEEVRDRLVEIHYPQAARELKLSLVDAHIHPGDIRDGQTFDFTVHGETYPQVTLGDWKSVSLTSSSPEITDEVLEKTLQDLRERNATFEAAERPIEATDMVTIQELGEQEAGSYPVYLDVAEPHVRDALVGKAKGDEVEITVPAHSHGDHEHPEHTVRVRIEDVKHKQLQELDDAFAASLNFESLERLRTDLKAELERRATSEGDTARREEFVQALVSGMTVDVPQALIQRRREAMLQEIQDDLSRQGVQWAEYEKFMQEQDKLDEFMADLNKNAETRVRRDLALEQLAEDQGVSLTDQQFNAALSALAQANNTTIQALRSQLGANGLNGYYASIVREQALTQAIASLTGEQGTQTPAEESSDAEGTGEGSNEQSEQGTEQSEQATEPGELLPETAQPGEDAPQGE
ncbi:trigger factor [Deinococcus sonorensis]|uniref:Trigger factor n=2 Tax=Deinococcus sonorensis TaxID=309891 RepID=A0AAU7UDG7_9DEIO